MATAIVIFKCGITLNTAFAAGQYKLRKIFVIYISTLQLVHFVLIEHTCKFASRLRIKMDTGSISTMKNSLRNEKVATLFLLHHVISEMFIKQRHVYAHTKLTTDVFIRVIAVSCPLRFIVH